MKQKRSGWLILPLVILTVVIAVILLLRFPTGLRVLKLLERTAERERMSCAVRLETEDFTGEATLSRYELHDERYYGVDFGGERLYLHDGTVYFSNGNGYAIDPWLDELGVPEEFDEKLLLLAGFREETDGEDTFYVFCPEDSPLRLLRSIIPELAENWENIRSLRVLLREEDGAIGSVTVQHERLSLSMDVLPDVPEPIPTEDLMKFTGQTLPDIRTLAPLLNACGRILQASDDLRADLSLAVECGPLPIRDTAELYLSQDGLRLVRGGQATELTSGQEDGTSVILALGWMMVRDGAWEPAGTDSGTFLLTVPAEDLETALVTVLPELAGLDFTLDDGILTVQIASGAFTGMELTCSGQMPFLITTIPLSIQIDLSIAD